MADIPKQSTTARTPSRLLGRVVAHIPARAGSKRVPSKNLRILVDRPMLAYAVEAALACPLLPEVYVNTDSPVIGELARKLGAQVFQRSSELASDTASGDDFTIDIIRKLGMDTLVMVSPVCPLVTTTDITDALDTYARSDADTLITCTKTQMQTFREGEPVNISLGQPLARSQDNPRVEVCNWAVTVWDAKEFERNYTAYRGGYLGTKRLLYPIDPLKAVKVSYEADFQLAEALVRAGRVGGATPSDPIYWRSEDTVTWGG